MLGNKETNTDWGKTNETPAPQRVETKLITSTNKSFYTTVAFALAATTILTVIGSFALAILGKEIPSALIALGSVSVGALASLFTNK